MTVVPGEMNMKTHLFLLGILGLVFMTTAQADSEHTIGWIEHVRIHPGSLVMKAKIDTGADNSSLHASNIQVHDVNGDQMVKFTVENKDGDVARFDLPLVRMAQIKRRGGSEPLQRPVVSMKLCIGNTLKDVDINLADRENFQYRMLIGRSYLGEQFLVSANKTFTIDPACNGEKLAKNDVN
jgi:hypothetical protein